MKGKKKIRRRPGTPRNMYFTKETGESIVKYCQEEDDDTRKKIYEKEILPAFDKLAENLIYVYGFKSPYCTAEELKVDCVSFMFETLHKWDPSRGTKAFSYFNVVAKNWFIINTRKHLKRRNRHLSIDDPNGMSSSQKAMFEDYDYVPPPDEEIIKRQVKQEILSLLEDMKMKLTNENEIKCLHAIETLFSSIEELELLNKRAVLLYIREISGLDKKHLSKSMSVIRRHYRSMSKLIDKYDIF
jgi:hypothetical protein